MSYKRSLQRALGYKNACKAFAEGKGRIRDCRLIIPGILEVKKNKNDRSWNVRLTTPNGEIQEFGWNGEKFYGLEVERHPASCHFQIGIEDDPEGISLELVVPVKRHMYFHVDYTINQAAERIVFTEKSDGTRYGVAYTVKNCQYNNLPKTEEDHGTFTGWIAGFQDDPDIDYSQYKLDYEDQELPEPTIDEKDAVPPVIDEMIGRLLWDSMEYKFTDTEFITEDLKVKIIGDEWEVFIKGDDDNDDLVIKNTDYERAIVRIDQKGKKKYLTIVLPVKETYMISKAIGPCCGLQVVETPKKVKFYGFRNDEVAEAIKKRKSKNGINKFIGGGYSSYSLNPDFEGDRPIPLLEEIRRFKSFN